MTGHVLRESVTERIGDGALIGVCGGLDGECSPAARRQATEPHGDRSTNAPNRFVIVSLFHS